MSHGWSSFVAFALASAAATPATPPAYDPTLFARAQAANRLIVIETYAEWCVPCRIQAPLLERLRATPPFEQLVVLRIDQASGRRVWRRFALSGYGSLVVFHGRREAGRGTPITEPELRALLQSGL